MSQHRPSPYTAASPAPVVVGYDPSTQTITVTPDTLDVNRGVELVIWRKADPDGPYQLQLVEFKSASAPFIDFSQGPQVISCIDRNNQQSAHGDWEYKICVLDTATGETHCLDPRVRNKSNGDVEPPPGS